MPPKVRIKKEQILAAACELVREEGIGSLNARALAKKTGCSTQPIFSTYASMEEVIAEVRQYGEEFFASYFKRYEKEENPLYRAGLAYLMFSREEGKLFELLFSAGEKNSVYHLLAEEEGVQNWVSLDAGLDRRYSVSLCRQFFFYIHGMACTPDWMMPPFRTESECRQLMKEFYKAYRKLYRKKSE